MTPGDAADVSPPIRPTLGTTISVRGGWVTPGCATLAAHVVNASSSANHLSFVRSTVDIATHMASGFSHVAVNMLAAGCSSTEGSLPPAVSKWGGPADFLTAPPPDQGAAVLVGGCCVALRATHFLSANAKGVIYRLAL
jgi:hypothetical protein